MSALVRLDVDRLAKVCGLFSSDQDGERATAAAYADRIVRGAGLTWVDVLVLKAPAATATRQARSPCPRELLARHGDRLTKWEREFLTSLARRAPPWSARRNVVLDDIRARCASGAS